jgi:hypothetical protein
MAVTQGVLAAQDVRFQSPPARAKRLGSGIGSFVAAPLTAGALLVAGLVVLSATDGPGRLAVWSSAILLVASMAGLVASLHGAREAETELDGWTRGVFAAGAFFFAIGRMVHFVGTAVAEPVPWMLDAMPVGGLLLVVIAFWWVSLRRRFTHSEQIAVGLDSAVVFFTAGAASLVVLGGRATGGDGALALAYTAVFSSVLGATLVLNLAITPKRGMFGWVALVAGVVPLAAGSAWEVTTAAGTWAPYALVQAAGALICGYGGATGRATSTPPSTSGHGLRGSEAGCRWQRWAPLRSSSSPTSSSWKRTPGPSAWRWTP